LTETFENFVVFATDLTITFDQTPDLLPPVMDGRVVALAEAQPDLAE
jgi:hypothetical protein